MAKSFRQKQLEKFREQLTVDRTNRQKQSSLARFKAPRKKTQGERAFEKFKKFGRGPSASDRRMAEFRKTRSERGPSASDRRMAEFRKTISERGPSASDRRLTEFKKYRSERGLTRSDSALERFKTFGSGGRRGTSRRAGGISRGKTRQVSSPLSTPFEKAFGGDDDREQTYRKWSERAIIVGFNSSNGTYSIEVTTAKLEGNNKRSLNRVIRQVKSLIAPSVKQFTAGDSVLIGYADDKREHPIILGAGDHIQQKPRKIELGGDNSEGAPSVIPTPGKIAEDDFDRNYAPPFNVEPPPNNENNVNFKAAEGISWIEQGDPLGFFITRKIALVQPLGPSTPVVPQLQKDGNQLFMQVLPFNTGAGMLRWDVDTFGVNQFSQLQFKRRIVFFGGTAPDLFVIRQRAIGAAGVGVRMSGFPDAFTVGYFALWTEVNIGPQQTSQSDSFPNPGTPDGLTGNTGDMNIKLMRFVGGSTSESLKEVFTTTLIPGGPPHLWEITHTGGGTILAESELRQIVPDDLLSIGIIGTSIIVTVNGETVITFNDDSDQALAGPGRPGIAFASNIRALSLDGVSQWDNWVGGDFN